MNFDDDDAMRVCVCTGFGSELCCSFAGLLCLNFLAGFSITVNA